jgi:hypothetical protein
MTRIPFFALVIAAAPACAAATPSSSSPSNADATDAPTLVCPPAAPAPVAVPVAGARPPGTAKGGEETARTTSTMPSPLADRLNPFIAAQHQLADRWLASSRGAPMVVAPAVASYLYAVAASNRSIAELRQFAKTAYAGDYAPLAASDTLGFLALFQADRAALRTAPGAGSYPTASATTGPVTATIELGPFRRYRGQAANEVVAGRCEEVDRDAKRRILCPIGVGDSQVLLLVPAGAKPGTVAEESALAAMLGRTGNPAKDFVIRLPTPGIYPIRGLDTVLGAPFPTQTADGGTISTRPIAPPTITLAIAAQPATAGGFIDGGMSPPPEVLPLPASIAAPAVSRLYVFDRRLGVALLVSDR